MLRNRPVFRSLLLSLLAALVIAILVGVFTIVQLITAVTQSRQAITEARAGNIVGACSQINRASPAWHRASFVTTPAAPFLQRLAFIPRIGGDLAILSGLVRLADEGSQAATVVCRIGDKAWYAHSPRQRLVAVVEALAAHPEALVVIGHHLERATAAWPAVAPWIGHSRAVAPYRTTLETLDRQWSTVDSAAASFTLLAPSLPWLLGVDAPRRFLMITQNPFELRPTGGFIGIVCVIEVEHARLSGRGCKSSKVYDAPASADMDMPVPYTRYLRLGQYYLRDANWAADFPTSAQRIEAFWQLNRQPAVDGVIAVDPFVLVPLLEAAGPLDLDPDMPISAAQIVDTILRIYYDASTDMPDKSRLARLMPAVLNRVTAVDPRKWPDLLAALQSVLTERHLLLYMNHPDLQRALATLDWDGGLRNVPQNVLRVVDADVGYGDVNAFVDRLTHLDLALNEQGQAVTATLTLTYTNRYSEWAESPTFHRVFGNCTDPATLQLERDQGCYANYVRVYVPADSEVLSQQGFEEWYAPEQRYGRTVMGGYVRIRAGEQRTLTMVYRLPASLSPGLLLEKQPGTLAPPFLVTLHQHNKHGTYWTSGSEDRRVHYQVGTMLTVAGVSDPAVAAQFAQARAFADGRDAWLSGQTSAAITRWQVGNVLDRAADYAMLEARSGRPENALRLLSHLKQVDRSGRANFEHAIVLEQVGQAQAAGAEYREAARLAPENAYALLTLARWRAAQDGTAMDAPALDGDTGAVNRWLFAASRLPADQSLPALRALARVRFTPDLALRYADLLAAAGDASLAGQRYADIATAEQHAGILARGRIAALAGDQRTAIEHYTTALADTDSYAEALDLGDRLQALGDSTTALRAYDLAATLDPTRPEPWQAAGDMLRMIDPVAARMRYEYALRLDQTSGYPEYGLGMLLHDAGQSAAAEHYLRRAAEKRPLNKLFAAALARVRADLQRVATP